ncbi:MAG: transcriptional repressor [Planctomycetes bacterium]|nr:transcriptional repressor [Planctomycetota bacterium]
MERMKQDFALGHVEVAMTPQQRFEEYLQSRQKRTTRQRRVIVEKVFDRHDHFDADQLLIELAAEKHDPRIGRATVYRTLSELVDAGLLRTMALGGRAVYEHDYGYPQHDHLHCQQCNRLIEFHSEELTKIRDAVAREYHFRPTGHRMIVSGTCEECQKARRRPTRPLDLI